MDRRSHARHAVEAKARITILGEAPFAMDAIVDNISGRGMRLRTDREIPLDSAVRVDFEDCMALGEVCHCQLDGRSFAVGLLIEQGLTQVSAIEALMRRLTSEEPGRRAPAAILAR